MKYDEYKKLEDKINNEDFNQSYKMVNIILTTFSYFGHIVSIFLAYFMLSKVISGAMTDNMILSGMISVIILTALELIKRSIFDKFSIAFLKMKGLTKQVMPLFLLSCFIIGISFYSSIKGAGEFSSKSDKIESTTKDSLNTFKEETTKAFELKINSKESEIVKSKKVLDDISTLALTQTKLTKDQRKIQTTMPASIDTLKAEKERLISERDVLIKEKEDELTIDSKGEKDKNDKNSFAFVIISTLIEIVILAGVYFGEYYKFRSYKEFRDKIEKDPNYQKWLLYNEILQITYTEDTKMNQKLASNKSIIEMCKVNEIIVMPKDMINFLKTMASLGIIKVSGSTRYVNKQRDLAFEILRKHFNIE